MRYGVGNVIYDSGETAWAVLLPFYSMGDLFEDADEFHEGDCEAALKWIIADGVTAGDFKEEDTEDILEAFLGGLEEFNESSAAEAMRNDP